MYRQVGFSLRSYPACSEGLELPTLDPHFTGIPQTPGVAYPQLAPPLSIYPACSGGRVSSSWTRTSRLSRVLRESRSLNLDPNFGANPDAPRIAYPQVEPSLGSYPTCSEGLVPLILDHQFGAIPPAPRVVYPQLAPPRQSYPTCSEGRVSSTCFCVSEVSRMLQQSSTLNLYPHFGAIAQAPTVLYP